MFIKSILGMLLAANIAGAATSKVDDSDKGWTWYRIGAYADDDAYKLIAHGTHNRNGYSQYTFNGTGVAVYGWQGPNGGQLEFIVDGVSRKTVSVASSVERYNFKMFEIANLSKGNHTLRIVSKNTRWVMIDYLLIEDGVTTTPAPTPSPTVSPSPSPTVTPTPTVNPSPTATPQDPTRYTDDRELVVRTIANFSKADDVVKFLDMAKRNNFNIVSVSIKQDEDENVPSGTVFYPSKIAPVAAVYKNFDVIGTIITEAAKRGIRVKAWIPQFHDQVAARKNADWAMKALVNGKIVPFQGSNPDSPEYFVNPINPEVQDYEISIIKEFLSMYKVDSVAIDWLRFDNWNMDMSDKTRSDFQAIYGYDPATINFAQSSTKRTQWNEFRMQKVADYAGRVKAAVKSVQNVPLGSYTLPPEFIECAQSAKRLAQHLDFFSPMAYYDDWGYQLNWVYDSVIADLVSEVGITKKIIPAYNYYWSISEFQQIYKTLNTRYPQIRGGSFFKYGKWTESDMTTADQGSKK
ncbi:putative glycoside hydrolase [Bdellovibrio sp. KM01]|uniref:putative glycoside hydrolase n=1 Tax=Bdellovibrio sp. KM01 TaxID=2748865 RepID=UPI0015E95B4F|nr:putative glycoside hydrolase [Bdellovibrio sp. KM01]QLY25131.1 family 10 glycosylhydrolase [Bdellovibrio sp. KM01]